MKSKKYWIIYRKVNKKYPKSTTKQKFIITNYAFKKKIEKSEVEHGNVTLGSNQNNEQR